MKWRIRADRALLPAGVGRGLSGVLLAAALAALTAGAAVSAAPAGSTEPLRVGLQAGGTFGWELEVMRTLGIQHRYNLNLQVTSFATKTAAETALRGNAVDVVVDDWTSVSRLRGQGVKVQAIDAFSRAIGGIVVRADSSIRNVGDLRGKRIGVVSLGDKSFLVLRALAIDRYGFDPQQAADVVPAAPPLLNRLLERGDLDAIVQYWQFVPRLTRTGAYRELASAVDMLAQMWPEVDLPFLVVVATDQAVQVKRPALQAFLAALRESKGQLAERRDLWDLLFDRGVLGLDDRTLLDGLYQRYRSGVPGPWDARTVEGLTRLTAKLVEVAGMDTLGVLALDPDAFNVTVASAR